MTLCTVVLLGLQGYWSYESYNNHIRVFKSDINEALYKAADRFVSMRRQAMKSRYKSWLADTNLVVITVRYSRNRTLAQYLLRDKSPLYSDSSNLVFNFSDLEYEPRIQKMRREPYDPTDLSWRPIKPKDRRFFIDKFVETVIEKDFETGTANNYTWQLRYLLLDEYRKNWVIDYREIQPLYKQELAKAGIYNDFILEAPEFTKTSADAFSFQQSHKDLYPQPDTTLFKKIDGHLYTKLRFGYFGQEATIKALFGNPGMLFFNRMKWQLLTSLLLLATTVTCFSYTIRTMLSQKKLAQLKDDFVNNMTHELKTPVATISVAAEAIQDFSLSRQSTNEYLGIIRHQASNLTYLIEQILQSMVANQAQIAVNRGTLSIPLLLKNAIHQYQPLLESKNAQIDISIHDENAFIIADSVHMGNVLANLLDNALKYGNDQPVIKIATRVSGNSVCISVSNKGEVIPEVYQDKVFDKFFRVPSGNIHNVKGYGLGLSYCRNVVERHGGTLVLTSNAHTTTIIITLKLAKNEFAQDSLT